MTRLTCPACTAPSLSVDEHGILACPYCGTRIVGGSQECPACGRSNPLKVDECLACGEPLTIPARVVLRHGRASGEPLFLEVARGQAAQLKSRGEVTSEARLDRFREMDRRRQEQEFEDLARRQARDRQLLLASAGAVGLLLLAIAIGFLTTVLR